MRSFSQLPSLLVGAEPSGATGQWYSVAGGCLAPGQPSAPSYLLGSAQVGFGLSYSDSIQVLCHEQWDFHE